MIITTEPNEVTGPIQDRMPVILRAEDEEVWLDRDLAEPDTLVSLSGPYPACEMKAYPVAPRANGPANDSAELLDPVLERAVAAGSGPNPT